MKTGNSVVKNVVFGFGSKIITLIFGLVIPRLLITAFGSDVNGLLSTITQIYTYIALLQAGIGVATTNALYKPLDNGDRNAICNVLSAAKRYYSEVTLIFFGAVLVFSAVYPFCVSSEIDKLTIFWVIFIQGLTNCVSYYFCAVYNQLLEADAHRYVTENVELLGYILTSAAKIFLISIGCNVISVQIANFVMVVVKVLITYQYCRKKYPWIVYRKKADKNLLEQRGSFIIHEVSTVVFSNTDIFIISSFCGLDLASVYTVYNLVYSSLNQLISTANAGLGFLLGQNFYKDKKKFLLLFRTYDTIYTVVVFIVFSIAYVLTFPFVSLYTKGVTDTQYILPYAPLLFALINLMSGARTVSAKLIAVTGNAKRTQGRSIAETIINLAASLILVQFFGIYGVLLGTVIALLYRMNDMIIFVNRHILDRKLLEAYKNIIVNGILFAAIVFISDHITLMVNSYVSFVVYGVIVSVIVTAVYLLANSLCNLSLVRNLKSIFKDARAMQETETQEAAEADTSHSEKPEGIAQIGIEDFMSVELRSGLITACESVKRSKELLKLQIDLGYETRQVVSGIAKFYQSEDLIGKKIILVANLKPAVLCGIESNGMLLAFSEDTVRVVFLSEDTPLGKRIR